MASRAVLHVPGLREEREDGVTVLDDLGLALTADGLMEAQYADLPVR